MERTIMNSAVSALSVTPTAGDIPQEIFTAHRLHLSENDLASRWGMSPKTLQRWRMEGRGPIYLKLGKRVAYSMSTVLEYEQRITHISTSERAKH